MMHANVVAKISFRRMTKERAHKPGDITMNPLIRPFETFTVTDAMKHEAKATLEI
jgi:hypothetical protein